MVCNLMCGLSLKRFGFKMTIFRAYVGLVKFRNFNTFISEWYVMGAVVVFGSASLFRGPVIRS